MVPGIGANDTIWDSIVTTNKSAYGTYMDRMQSAAADAAKETTSPIVDQSRQQFMSMVQKTLVSEESFNENRAKAREKVNKEWEESDAGKQRRIEFEKAEKALIDTLRIQHRNDLEKVYADSRYQEKWRPIREQATAAEWDKQDPYHGMTYEQYTRHAAQGLSNNGLASWLYKLMDPVDAIKMQTQLSGMFSNIAGQQFQLGDREAFAKADYITKNLFAKDGRFEYNRAEYGGMDKIGAAYLARELSKAADTVDGVDSGSNTQQLKTATERLRQRVQDYARALEPLKDVFGKDVPQMLKAVESISGMTIANMGTQRVRQVATAIADREQRGLYTMNDLAANNNVTLQMMDRMGVSSGNKIYAMEQTMKMLDMTRGSFQSNWMTKADSDRNITRLVLNSENSDAEDAIAAAYGMWKQQQTAAGATNVSQERFRSLITNKLQENPDAQIVDVAMGLVGATHAQQLEEGKYYSGYAEAKRDRSAAGLVTSYNASSDLQEMRNKLATSPALKRALANAGIDTANWTPRDQHELVDNMQKLMLARPQLANMNLEDRRAALAKMATADTISYTDLYGNTQHIKTADVLGSAAQVNAMAAVFEGAKNLMPEYMDEAGRFHNYAEQVKASKTAKSRRAAIEELGIIFPSDGAELLEDLLAGDGKGFSIESTSKMLNRIQSMQLEGLTDADKTEIQALTTGAGLAMRRNIEYRLDYRDRTELNQAVRRGLAAKWREANDIKADAELTGEQQQEQHKFIDDALNKVDPKALEQLASSDAKYVEYKEKGRAEYQKTLVAEESEDAKNKLIYSLTDPRALKDENYRAVVKASVQLYNSDQMTRMSRPYKQSLDKAIKSSAALDAANNTVLAARVEYDRLVTDRTEEFLSSDEKTELDQAQKEFNNASKALTAEAAIAAAKAAGVDVTSATGFDPTKLEEAKAVEAELAKRVEDGETLSDADAAKLASAKTTISEQMRKQKLEAQRDTALGTIHKLMEQGEANRNQVLHDYRTILDSKLDAVADRRLDSEVADIELGKDETAFIAKAAGVKDADWSEATVKIGKAEETLETAKAEYKKALDEKQPENKIKEAKLRVQTAIKEKNQAYAAREALIAKQSGAVADTLGVDENDWKQWSDTIQAGYTDSSVQEAELNLIDAEARGEDTAYYKAALDETKAELIVHGQAGRRDAIRDDASVMSKIFGVDEKAWSEATNEVKEAEIEYSRLKSRYDTLVADNARAGENADEVKSVGKALLASRESLDQSKQARAQLLQGTAYENTALSSENEEKMREFSDAMQAMKYIGTPAMSRYVKNLGKSKEAEEGEEAVLISGDDELKSLFQRGAKGYEKTDTASQSYRRAVQIANADNARDLIRDNGGVIDDSIIDKLSDMGFDSAELSSLGYKIAKKGDSDEIKKDNATIAEENVAMAQIRRLGSVYGRFGRAGVSEHIRKEAIAASIKEQEKTADISEREAGAQTKLFQDYYSWADKNNEAISAESFSKFLDIDAHKAKSNYTGRQRAQASAIYNAAQQGTDEKSGQPTDVAGLINTIVSKLTDIFTSVEGFRKEQSPSPEGTGTGVGTEGSKKEGK